jgi:hypothetical protein
MPDSKPSTVTFHYIKSNFFRTVHTTGVFGGLNPDGTLYVVAFNDRAPLPDVTVQKIENNGQLGGEIIEQRKSTDGIVRELEVGMTMDVRTAQLVVDWLKERIEFANKLSADMQQKTEVKQ